MLAIRGSGGRGSNWCVKGVGSHLDAVLRGKPNYKNISYLPSIDDLFC